MHRCSVNSAYSTIRRYSVSFGCATHYSSSQFTDCAIALSGFWKDHQRPTDLQFAPLSLWYTVSSDIQGMLVRCEHKTTLRHRSVVHVRPRFSAHYASPALQNVNRATRLLVNGRIEIIVTRQSCRCCHSL